MNKHQPLPAVGAEEAAAGGVLNKVKLIKGEGQGMLMLETELAARPPLFVFPGQAGSE